VSWWPNFIAEGFAGAWRCGCRAKRYKIMEEGGWIRKDPDARAV